VNTPYAQTFNFAPIAELVPISLDQANDLLVLWDHKMGMCNRGNGYARCYGLLHNGVPVACTITSTLIRETVAGLPMLDRSNAIELSRLCAIRPGLCRVMLRMWREFVSPTLGYPYAISYQDADAHTGNTYRFDGWKRAGYSHSGTDSRSGRKGRDKWIWVWPELPIIELVTQ
jgi:hypothetical protein